MRNFTAIAQGIDTAPVLAALARNGDLWNQHPIRTGHPQSAHAQADDILVFYGETDFSDVDGLERVINGLDVRPYPAWSRLPQLRPLVLGLMTQVAGVRLGRVVITRLPPGAAITPHADAGAPAEHFDRYQIALQSLPGTVFRCGAENQHHPTGTAFMFDNQIEHEVLNGSADDRIALICDIRSA